MRIPRFWAVVEGSGTDPHGRQLFRRVWGWSMSSASDALDVAHEQLRSALSFDLPEIVEPTSHTSLPLA